MQTSAYRSSLKKEAVMAKWATCIDCEGRRSSNGTDHKLLQAKRLLDITNPTTIAEAERHRLIAEARAKYLPEHLDKVKMGEWEVFKIIGFIAIFVLMLALPSPPIALATKYLVIMGFVLTCCGLISIHAGLTLACLSPERSGSRAFRLWLVLSSFFVPFCSTTEFIIERMLFNRAAKRFNAEAFHWVGSISLKDKSTMIENIPTGESVRDYAVAEIERIRADTIGPDSEMAKAEEGLAELLSQAESMRLQILHRLKKATGDRLPPLEEGMELAKKRESNLRKALSRHRDAMSRARAALNECLAQAQGLDENVADAELLKKLEEQVADDERQIALSELVMKQAISNLRGRTMSIVTVLAQLEPNRVIGANQTHVAEEEHEAYLGRIETAAEKLAAI